MTRNVKGALFADYVRMLRTKKDVDWSRYLAPEDLAYLHQQILSTEWYPMATFERFGLAILAELAKGTLELVEAWGRSSIDSLRRELPDLLVVGDPRETLMRFQVLRRTFFDFQALEIRYLNEGEARVEINYQMGKVAEEAASHQTIGFFERLLELAGAREWDARFASKSWEGDAVTTLLLRWQ